MMDTAFNKAVDYNNAAAKHIDRDNCVSAIRALTSGFHAFKKSYNRNKSISPPEQQRPTSNFNIDQWMRKMPCCCNENNENDETVVVYIHPIQVPKDLESNMENCSLVSTAITFNLALANHLEGSRRKDPQMLQTAARLYEYGFSLERIRGKFYISPFFLVTILNNLGALHRELEGMAKTTTSSIAEDQDDDLTNSRSQKCFHQLLSTLLYLTQVKGANPNDLEVFFGNSSRGMSRTSTHCAGAA